MFRGIKTSSGINTAALKSIPKLKMWVNDESEELVDEENVPVLCFGLRTDFRTHLFPGSQRLFELADSIQEIKTICECGAKATVNARIGADGRIITSGSQVMLGGNDRYTAMCHRCWMEAISQNHQLPEG
jgi:thymidine kinase